MKLWFSRKKNPLLNRMIFFREINFIFDTKKENDFFNKDLLFGIALLCLSFS